MEHLVFGGDGSNPHPPYGLGSSVGKVDAQGRLSETHPRSRASTSKLPNDGLLMFSGSSSQPTAQLPRVNWGSANSHNSRSSGSSFDVDPRRVLFDRASVSTPSFRQPVPPSPVNDKQYSQDNLFGWFHLS
jgi:hypothetical protein